MKQCTQCLAMKSLSEFHRHKHGKHGRHPVCKSCRKFMAAQRYANDVLGCRTKQLAASKTPASREQHHQFYLENRTKLIAKNVAYGQTALGRQKKRAWLRQHPEVDRAHYQRRRAHKAAASMNDFTDDQWIEMQAAYDHRCAYCGKRAKGKLTRDHISPLSAHGDHTVANIVPACRPCNRKKYIGPPLSPVQPLLITIAPSKPYKPRGPYKPRKR